MLTIEIINEAKVSVRSQILNDVQLDGGNTNEYFVRFTSVDKLGYSARQFFARTRDIDDSNFDINSIGDKEGRLALWFYPLSTYLKSKDLYASNNPYVWLVRIKPNAWLQPVNNSTKGKVAAPQGKERAGILRQTTVTTAAIFFKPAFTVIGKYYDYGSQHQRHGQVKGAPEPTFFQRVRGEM
jgi:hypothetical protein